MAEKSMPTQSYFTCTLGEAAEINAKTGKKNFKTVNEMIDIQALEIPHRWAVGFPDPSYGSTADGWGVDLYSFKQLKHGIIYVAKELRSFISYHPEKSSHCVALLCQSSVDFLFTWLGLIRNGASVLLVAPQCEPKAIYQLCKSCDVSILLHDRGNSSLATAAVQISSNSLKAILLPWQVSGENLQLLLKTISQSPSDEIPIEIVESDVAYIHHTSGTSSGLPKPIYQTHRVGVGVLPRLDGANKAIFTTTPLYHGGIADCFRAWTSGALIWLFPGADLPITTKNILSSIAASQKAETLYPKLPIIKYFSSVPYILQMLAEDAAGLDALRKMAIVGVGGAALPQLVGDDLVKNGVNLISRFGSAECGFLLSSHRYYEGDKDWQHLRIPANNEFLKFEEQSDGSKLAELVVLKGWPHMAKSNRKDMSFATCDLFEPHGTIPGAWKYHSRSDSQITLITGKKFDPAPIEEELAAASYISEVMIFGNGMQQVGALVFPFKAQEFSETEIEQKIWDNIEKKNSKGQPHTRISRALVVIMDYGCVSLPRSSKGTILRGQAEKAFCSEIKNAYKASLLSVGDQKSRFMIIDQVRPFVEEIVNDVVGEMINLDAHSDFYACGVDSTMCTQIRSMIEQQVLQNQQTLPWNIVYDCGNIQSLSNYIIERIEGNESNNNAEKEMLDLARKYTVLEQQNPGNQVSRDKLKPQSHVVLLTGATGALGTEVLQVLRQDHSVSRVVCLVRASGSDTARLRVSESLLRRRKPPIEDQENICCLSSRLAESDLGLSKEILDDLRSSVTHIIHAAWAVNFLLPLRSFNDNIAGVRNLINLAISGTCCAQMIFCSSTASVLGSSRTSTVPEAVSVSPSDADKLGYSRSKWVAEAICSAAAKQQEMIGRFKILRIGQLTGNTEHGIWNMSEAWPLLLSTVDVLGCLPQLEESLSWLPLNIAAKAVVELSFATHSKGQEPDGRHEWCIVYHVCNNSRATSWFDLLLWVQRERKEKFEIVDKEVWLKKLEEVESHPAKNLIGLWKRGFEKKEGGANTGATKFETKRAESVSNAMKTLNPIDEVLVRKIWCWLKEKEKVM